MTEFLVLVEHRKGEIRDITFEMLSKALELGEKTKAKITALLLGHNVTNLAKKLSDYSHNVIIVDDPKLEIFDSETYQQVLSYLIQERKPLLTIIGQTSFGIYLQRSNDTFISGNSINNTNTNADNGQSMGFMTSNSKNNIFVNNLVNNTIASGSGMIE